jgi:hypothetical protein
MLISLYLPYKLLSKLNDHKAAGPDAVPPRLLRQLADIIAPALTRIFQTSLDKGAVPKEWRTASVALSNAFEKSKSMASTCLPSDIFFAMSCMVVINCVSQDRRDLNPC